MEQGKRFLDETTIKMSKMRETLAIAERHIHYKEAKKKAAAGAGVGARLSFRIRGPGPYTSEIRPADEEEDEFSMPTPPSRL